MMMKDSKIDLCGWLGCTEGPECSALAPRQPFRFSCAGCGDCCRGREDIVLSGCDLHRVCVRLRLPAAVVLRGYCRHYTGAATGLPVVRLQPLAESGSCPFFYRKRCAIHDAKPLVCVSTDLLVISEDVAEHHIKDICRMVLRDWKGDPKAELAVVQGESAFSALSLESTVDIRAVSLAEQLRLARKNNIINTKDALSFSVARLAGAKELLPMIRPHDKGYTIIGYYEEKSI